MLVTLFIVAWALVTDVAAWLGECLGCVRELSMRARSNQKAVVY